MTRSHTRSRALSRWWLLIAVAGIMTLFGSLGASVASAAFGIKPGSFDGGVFAQNGGPLTQAGGRPFEASTTFELNTVPEVDYIGRTPLPDGGALKDVDVELPPGLIGDPNATPKCPSFNDIILEVEKGEENAVSCPLSSQVGIAEVRIGSTVGPAGAVVYTPVFNMQPPPGTPAAFGFDVLNAQPVLLTAALRSDSDYGVTIRSTGTSQAAVILGVKVKLWGVPADPSHDQQRCRGSRMNVPTCIGPPGDLGGGPNSAESERTAFLANPTSCTAAGAGLRTKLTVTSWKSASAPDSASFESHLPPGFPLSPQDWGPPQGPTGCDDVPFGPDIAVETTSHLPDAPTGLDVDLSVPQDHNPDGTAQAHLKRASVTLPEGMTINPSAADGLQACSDAQLKLRSRSPAECPADSQIGTATVDTPLLAEPLEGTVHVRSQNSDDPSSGEMFRIAIALRNDHYGIVVKLPGQVRANPTTGRLEATFDDNPQLPFERFRLRFKGGPRAPLANPPTCGPKSVQARLSAWSGKTVDRSDTIQIDCPGFTGFAPSFQAGTIAPTAGSFSPFAVRIQRPDQQQYIDGLALELPTGLVAKLRGVPLCPEAQMIAGTCSAGSGIGSATVGSGSGADPFFLVDQPVYLGGAYKGAPYSLSVAVRAIAGPFDLGTVVVRQAIFVDPVDASLTVVSDPVPTIVKGVPLRLRSLNVDVDRPEFTLNPTSCAEKLVRATFHSQQGTSARASARFQVGECSRLSFKPKVSMRLTGRKQVRVGRHPGVRATVTQTPGQAGIKQVQVRLPLSLALDPDNARALCEFEDGLRAQCPDTSVVGHATAVSPVLNQPLRGRVYFVKGVRVDKRTGRRIRTLPTLLVALRGEVAIDLRAISAVKANRLVTTFAAVPDAPVSRFNLKLNGGEHGILVVTGKRTNLCRGKQVASTFLDAHSGKRFDRTMLMRAPCTKQKGKRKR